MLILDPEKIVHELACLYVMLEIREGKLQSSPTDDIEKFLDHFKSIHAKFHDEIIGVKTESRD